MEFLTKAVVSPQWLSLRTPLRRYLEFMWSDLCHVECLRSNAIMFYNYFRGAVRLKGMCTALHAGSHMLTSSTLTLEGHVHCITRGITHAHIINTYCSAWRAVHMLSVAIYAENN